MKANTIDPTSFDTDHPLSAAMRTVSRYWFLAYSKLMSMEWQWSDTVPYGATDGRRLLLNKLGIAKLCRQPNASGLIAFLLVHEALHALLGHGWRLAKLPDHKRANVAADYVINAMIAMRNRELKKEVFPFIDGVLLDEPLSGDNSAEQLYRILSKPQPQPQPQPEPQPQPQPEDGDDSGDDSGDSDSGDSDSGDDSGDDSDSGKSKDGDELGPDDLSDFVGTGAPDTLEPEAEEGETQQEAIDQIEEANDRILVADDIDRRKQAESGMTGQRVGTQRADASKMNWPDLLRQWLTQKSRSGWEGLFNAPVFLSVGTVAAGRRSKRAGDIVLVIDTSGSIGQSTYDRFLSEAQSVLDELNPERLHLLSVSHTVCDAVTLERSDAVPTKLKGGGGTAFHPAFDWVAKNVDEVDVMVYLTDGWSDDLPELKPVDYPLLWLTTERPAKEFPIGEALEITEM